jgi:hypothetical protein
VTLDGRSVRHALFEVVIVAVCVLLALAVEEMREAAQRRELVAETRAALRTELLANRQRLVSKLEALAGIYLLVDANPEQVGGYVRERRNRALVLSDAAWGMAVQTGVIRWLEPEERMAFAEAYSSQRWGQEVVSHEMTAWTALAAFDPGPAGEDVARRRREAAAVWRAWADRAYSSVCVQSARYERALGASYDHRQVVETCLTRPTGAGARELYGEWERRGWLGKPGSPFKQ